MFDPILAAYQRSYDQNRAMIEAGLLGAPSGGPLGMMGPTAGALTMAANGGRPVLMAQDPGAVHVNAPLPNVSIMYKNREAIADDVLPIVKVQKRSDKYWAYSTRLNFQLANVDIGDQLGQPSQLSPSQTAVDYSCTDRVLRDYIPQATLDNADAPLSPLVDSTTVLNAALRLARENRVANNVVFNTASYGSNTAPLAGGNRWDTATGVPITNIQDAIALCAMFPTIAVIGEQAFLKFINNAEVKGFFTSRPRTALGDTPFFMDAEVMGKALTLRKFLVGRMKYDSANDGQTANLGNWIWGKSFALIHIPETLGVRVASFGATFRWVGVRVVDGVPQSGEFITRSWYEPKLGPYGAHAVQVSHADAEVNINSTGECGYLYTTVIS